MARVKGGVTTRRRHKKILKLAEGYRMTRGKQIKKAIEATLHADDYAYRGRKNRKREARSLWIIRINAALAHYGVKYSQFINNLKSRKIEIDRKILAQIATNYPKLFGKIVESVK